MKEDQRFGRLLRLRQLREQLGAAALARARLQLVQEQERARHLTESAHQQADEIAGEASHASPTSVAAIEMSRLLTAHAFAQARTAEASAVRAHQTVEHRHRELLELAKAVNQMSELEAAARRASFEDAQRMERKMLDELIIRRSQRK